MAKRNIRVHVESDGTTDGVAIVDSDTGEELIFSGATYQWQAIFIPGQGGVACVRLDLRDVPVVSPCAKPFDVYSTHTPGE